MDHQEWQLSGTVLQTVYSPKGTIEGLLLDVEGVTVQFVCEQDLSSAVQSLAPGAEVTCTGSVRPSSDKGEAHHDVYDLSGIEGLVDQAPEVASGRVVRINFAKHGEPNGVVLDSGDFLHLKPSGMRAAGWKVGDQVSASGPRRPLVDGHGSVVEVESA